MNDKGYPDFDNSNKVDKNNIIMYSQDNYKENTELNKLLLHSSKCSTKESSNLIWTSNISQGKPEFIIINKSKNLAIINEKYKYFIKYYNSIKRYMKRINNKELINQMNIKVRNAFEKDKYEVKDLIIYLANTFEVYVDICFWIVEKN